MKKILFLAVLSAAVLTMQAQIVKQLGGPQLSKGVKVLNIEPDQEPFSNYPHKPYNDYTSSKGIQALNKVLLGSSVNPYSILLQSQTCLTANDDLNTIMFTHRKDVPLQTGENSGFIQTTWSTDGGLNWNRQIVYDNTTKLGRYPSGVIYNPSGNTTVNNAYAIAAGPFTGGSGWLGSFRASKTFGGANGNISLNDEDEGVVGYTNLPRDWMHVDNTGRIRLMGEKNTDDGTSYTSYKTVIYTGVFNSTTNAWDWTEMDKVPDYTQGTGVGPDGYRTPGMAWSEDGQTGYLVYVGRNATAIDADGYHPIVYKTTDGGTTWTMMPAFDWGGIPAISDELIETGTPGVSRPLFGLIEDCIVDGNGNLHFVSFINSAYSTHPDSLAYSWSYTSIEGLMYHCWMTNTGWDADVIDIQWGMNVEDTESPIAVAWDNRLQMSKTPDGQKIAFAWLDTDTTFSTSNLYPDVWVQKYDITSGERSASLNLTTGTNFESNNFFMYLSNYSFEDTNGDIILHITTSEYGTADTDPVDHYYLTDAKILASINESPKGNLSFVSQNYPNPFNGTTSIDITMNKASQVSIDVTNMLGQAVSSTSKHLTEGTHTVTLNADNLKSGIYFYTVKTDNSAVTHKMIVK